MQTRTELTRVLTNKGFFDLEFRRKTEEREIFELTTQMSFFVFISTTVAKRLQSNK
jgi:hypothetical protein